MGRHSIILNSLTENFVCEFLYLKALPYTYVANYFTHNFDADHAKIQIRYNQLCLNLGQNGLKHSQTF